MTCSILFKGVQTAGQVNTHISDSAPVQVSSPSDWWSDILGINGNRPRYKVSVAWTIVQATPPRRGNEAAAAASFSLGLNGLRALGPSDWTA